MTLRLDFSKTFILWKEKSDSEFTKGFQFFEDDAQVIMDRLWELGLRPSDKVYEESKILP